MNKYHVRFPGLGWEFDISNVAFQVGNYSVYWYGLIIATGLLLALLYAWRTAPRYNVNTSKLFNCVMVGIITGIIGARLYYVKKMKFLPILDITMISFLIGQGIGRWGNFMNQEAFGAQTDLPWRMISENTVIDGQVVAVHPCFLYESLWCLLGFVLLHFYGKYRQRYAGQIFYMYLLWYGFERTVVEGLRTDSLYLPFRVFGTEVRVSQALSAVLMVIGAVMLIINIKKEDPFYANYRRKKGFGGSKGKRKRAH